MVAEIISGIVIGTLIGTIGWVVVRDTKDIGLWVPVGVGAGLALSGTLLINMTGLSETPSLGWKDGLMHVVLAVIGVASAVTLQPSDGDDESSDGVVTAEAEALLGDGTHAVSHPESPGEGQVPGRGMPSP